MKKILSVLLSALLLLSLTACGAADKLSDAVADKIIETIQPGTGSAADPAAAQKGAELAKELGLTDSGWLAADSETTPYGQYRTVEEWEAIFNGEADYDNAPAPVQATPPAPIIVDGEAGYTGEAKTVIFSEDNFEEGEVGVFDWKSMVSAEELAEWEAFDPNDPEFQELMKESQEATEALENSGVMNDIEGSYGDMPNMDDLQSQLDEALKQAQEQLGGMDLEGLGLGDLDLNALLGGLG